MAGATAGTCPDHDEALVEEVLAGRLGSRYTASVGTFRNNPCPRDFLWAPGLGPYRFLTNPALRRPSVAIYGSRLGVATWLVTGAFGA